MADPTAAELCIVCLVQPAYYKHRCRDCWRAGCIEGARRKRAEQPVRGPGCNCSACRAPDPQWTGTRGQVVHQIVAWATEMSAKCRSTRGRAYYRGIVRGVRAAAFLIQPEVTFVGHR